MHVTMFTPGDLVYFHVTTFNLTLPLAEPPVKEAKMRATLLNIDCEAGIATVRTMDSAIHCIPVRAIHKLLPGTVTVP